MAATVDFPSTFTTTPAEAATQRPSPTSTSIPPAAALAVQTAVPSFSPTITTASICSPLAQYTLDDLKTIQSRGFDRPRPSTDEGHHGLDFAHWRYKDRVTLEGVAVQSVLTGVVAGMEDGSWPYGNMIIIESPADALVELGLGPQEIERGQALYILYAHMAAAPEISLGDPVACGEALGQVGNTGNSGNPHLHIETRWGPPGIRFDGMVYYTTLSTEAERANYSRWRLGNEFAVVDPWPVLNLLAGRPSQQP